MTFAFAPARPQETPYLMPTFPDEYRFLSVLSGVPFPAVLALKLSGLWTQGEQQPITEPQRALIRRLAGQGRIRYVPWGESGYVLTGAGEMMLDVFQQRYGPMPVRRRYAPASETARAWPAEQRAAYALLACFCVTPKQVDNAQVDGANALRDRGLLWWDRRGYALTVLGEKELEAYWQKFGAPDRRSE
jgi:hypothetical protein